MRLRHVLSFVTAMGGIIACAGSDGGLNSGILPTENSLTSDASASDGSVDGGDVPLGSGKCQPACPTGQVCSEGNCVAIPGACPCPSESYCDPATKSCKVGCTKNDECDQGRYCDTGKRRCSDGCRTSADCSPTSNGEVECKAGQCVAHCESGYHACGGKCRADADPNACGAACTVCATKPNSTASCVGGSCRLACALNFHECGGACVSNGDVASCGTSCTPCPSVANGTPACSGGSCGANCNDGFWFNPTTKTCARDCVVAGCSASEWCDKVNHTCKPGCERHDQCAANRFCDLTIHACDTTSITQDYDLYPCPTGFDFKKSCGTVTDMCVNEWLPSGTTYPVDTLCPPSSSQRGAHSCGGVITRVCVPN